MANTKVKKGTTTKNAVPKAGTTPKNVHLGDGVADVAKAKANEHMQGIASDLVDMFFDYIKSKGKEIPDAIKGLLENPETKKEVASLWSEQLYKQGIVPKGYAGLSDELLIHNFHQDGYLDGMYVGHLLTMVAMTQHGIHWEDCKDIGRSISFGCRYYEKREELVQQLTDELREYANNANRVSDSVEE